MMFGIELQPDQYFTIEGYDLDPVNQIKQHLVLGILPDYFTGFLHALVSPVRSYDPGGKYAC
jgi:hypothetical protein